MKNRFFNVVFEDDHIVVVDKAAGVYSIDPRHSTKDPILSEILQNHYGNIFILHRLDRETSGLIMFAKSGESHKKFSELINENRIDKYYMAFVDGKMDFDGAYLIDVPIFIDPGKSKVRIDEKGKPSQTKIRILENYYNFSLIEAKLITGRTHQIRIHLQYIGHPLIVDKLYGKRDALYLSEIKIKYHHSKLNDELPLVTRQTLHCHQLNFVHPFSEIEQTLNSDLPKDLKALKNQLSKINKDKFI
jgi:RluA family pseudouridine synthase